MSGLSPECMDHVSDLLAERVIEWLDQVFAQVAVEVGPKQKIELRHFALLKALASHAEEFGLQEERVLKDFLETFGIALSEEDEKGVTDV